MVVQNVEARSPTESTVPDSVRRLLVDQLPVLRTVARRLCRSAAETEELVQAVLDTALRSIDTVDVRNHPRGWMVRALHDLHIDRCRARARDAKQAAVHEASSSATEPTTVPVWSEVAGEEIRHAAAQLPDELRTPYVMFALEGYSYAEIAARLRIAEATISARLLRARARVKQILVARHAGPGGQAR
jgi:RNA polymerase sigma factor (sigma-70 family)